MHKFVLLALLIAASDGARVKRRTMTNETQWDNQYFQASEDQEFILQGNENYTELPKRARCSWHLTSKKTKTYYFLVQDTDKHMAIKLVRNDDAYSTGPHITVSEGYSWNLDLSDKWSEEGSYDLVAHKNEIQHEYEINFKTDVKSVGLNDVGGAAVLSIEYNNGSLWQLVGGAWLLPNRVTNGHFHLKVFENERNHHVVPLVGIAGGIAAGVAAGIAIGGAIAMTGGIIFIPALITGVTGGLGGMVVGTEAGAYVNAGITHSLKKKRYNKSLNYAASVKIFDKLWCQNKFFRKCSQTRMCSEVTHMSRSNSACLCEISDSPTPGAD